MPAWNDRAPFEEAFRILRSNLVVALAGIEPPTVIVTSARPNEGKTTTSTQLAMSFAASGRRTVLVDLDFRHPDAHHFVGAHNEFGASEVLLGHRSLEDSIQYIEVGGTTGGRSPGLYFLSTGSQVHNPAELLGLGRTLKLLEGLASQADLVLIDTPPVLPIADTLIVGRMASGALLVTEARTTAIAAVQKAKDLLIRNRTRLLGVVINRFDQRDAPYTYGYGYGSSPDGHARSSGSESANGASGSPSLEDDDG